MRDMINYIDSRMQSAPLHGMFTAVPPRYDQVNRIITWGLDNRWRRQAAKECLASQPRKVLDLCCGTGDLAIDLAQLAEKDVELTGIDYSQPMLEIAKQKAERLAKGRKVSFTHGDAANLPFPDEYFDCVGISFAFRNLTYRNPLAWSHIVEVSRVLCAGGRFVIVETSQPRPKLIRTLYHLYLRWLVSKLGHFLSGNKGAYHYLAESAARFYTCEELKEILITAGFRQVFFRPLFSGVVGIHIAVK